VSDRAPRKSAGSNRPAASRAAKRWAAPAMLTCWVLGLLWVVVYYVAGDRIPVMADLGGWNIVVGMAVIGLGFVFATQWE
jgi:hypothetical protein